MYAVWQYGFRMVRRRRRKRKNWKNCTTSCKQNKNLLRRQWLCGMSPSHRWPWDQFWSRIKWVCWIFIWESLTPVFFKSLSALAELVSWVWTSVDIGGTAGRTRSSSSLPEIWKDGRYPAGLPRVQAPGLCVGWMLVGNYWWPKLDDSKSKSIGPLVMHPKPGAPF